MNSPLLLELPPCGQVQVMKSSRLMAQVSRALIRNGMGDRYMFSFIPLCINLGHVVEVLLSLEIELLLNNILSC